MKLFQMGVTKKRRRPQPGGGGNKNPLGWITDTIKQIVKKPRKTHKKMICSPYGAKTTAGSYTCYSKDVLNKIKKAYNQEHIQDPIKATDTEEIAKELRRRLSSKCEKEDCWLNLLPKDQRDFLDEMVFAPDQPKEWESNPDEWLSNFDIANVLKQYEKTYPHFRFLGPSPIDFDTKMKDGKCVWEDICQFSLADFRRRNITDIGFVFNLDDHDEPGSHWTSMYLSIPHRMLFYFDSAMTKDDQELPPEIISLKTRILDQAKEAGIPLKFDHNVKQHQYQNTECGMYSLYFILTLLTGKCGGLDRPIGFDQAIRRFKFKRIPDKAVFAFRDRYYNKTMETT
jgi:hypothetical protein